MKQLLTCLIFASYTWMATFGRSYPWRATLRPATADLRRGRDVRSLIFLFFAMFGLISVDGVRAQEVPPPPAQSDDKDDSRKDELAEKLIKQATGQSDDDIMKRIMDLMAGTSRRLAENADGGENTQSIQRDIVKELDAAIEQALAQRRPQKSPQPGQSSADKRNLPEPGQQQRDAQATGSEGAQSGTDPGPTENAAADEQRAKLLGDLLESRRTWGNLPARDREEIIQGAEEEIIERYRPMIERYYQSLAESEDEE